MITRDVVRLLGPVVLAACAVSASVLSVSVLPPASAECPDVDVVFARGTGDPPGVGPVGQAFVDALTARLGGKSLGVYPVDYPATEVWDTGIDGIRDAANHVVSTAASCPKTKMVLGGYSQGAAVMGFVTSAAVPAGVDPATVPKPLDPALAAHVAAVVLFGMPNVRAMNFLNEPPVDVGPLYQGKTLELCVRDDPVCSDGMNFAAHDTYADDVAMINRGADFAIQGLQTPAGTAVPGATPGQSFGS